MARTSMPRPLLAVLGLLILLVATTTLPVVSGHPAAEPPAGWRRLVHDYNDDYHGGDVPTHDGHDVIALDVQEAPVGTVRFRLFMNGGVPSAGTLKEVLTFKADGVAKTLVYQTTDNQAWSGTCDSYGAKAAALNSYEGGGLPDNNRFTIDCIVSTTTLGVVPGAKLTEFKVESFIGETMGDYMPGGYHANGVHWSNTPPTEQAEPAAYAAPSHAVRLGAPRDLTATAGPNRATLAWLAPSPVGESGPTGYVVYRNTSASAFAEFARVGPSTSYIASGLAPGVTYTFRLAALNGGGTGTNSTQVQVAATAPVAVPSAPTNVAATAGDGQVVVTWSGPNSDGGATVTSYKVYRGTSATALTEVATATQGTHTSTGLTNGMAYHFAVAAVNSAGTGGPSATVSATPAAAQAVPGVPRDLTAVAGDGNVTLTWRAPASDGGAALSGYRLYSALGDAALTDLATAPAANTSFIVAGLTNGASYRFAIAAVNSVGVGAQATAVESVPSSSDLAGPVIRDVVPTGTITGTAVTIAANYSDPSGITLASVVLRLDGVTLAPTTTATRVTYAATALAPGQHNVTLSVADTLGHVGYKNWTFTVPAPDGTNGGDPPPTGGNGGDETGPTITAFTPADGTTVTTAKPVLSARIADASGVQSSSVRLRIDGRDLAATFDGSTVSFTPNLGFSAGKRTVTVLATDTLGNAATATWSFTIAEPAPPTPSPTPPTDEGTPQDPTPEDPDPEPPTPTPTQQPTTPVTPAPNLEAGQEKPKKTPGVGAVAALAVIALAGAVSRGRAGRP